MTNYEFYEEAIINVIAKSNFANTKFADTKEGRLSVATLTCNGKVKLCPKIKCEHCMFFTADKCLDARREWADQEHGEEA